jgi:hypothetical protein
MSDHRLAVHQKIAQAEWLNQWQTTLLFFQLKKVGILACLFVWHTMQSWCDVAAVFAILVPTTYPYSTLLNS